MRVSLNAGDKLFRAIRVFQWLSDASQAQVDWRADPPQTEPFYCRPVAGLSGSGKSTIANVLLVRLLERGDRVVRLLDGDIVRTHLTSELGFSREHRDLNIQRIDFVASEITRCGGVALCAAIAPYEDARRGARRQIETVGGFLLIHVATPLNVCERRDPKGLYAKARAGLLPQFTGISDPYEVPGDPDLTVDTTEASAEETADRIVSLLTARGYLEQPRQIDAALVDELWSIGVMRAWK